MLENSISRLGHNKLLKNEKSHWFKQELQRQLLFPTSFNSRSMSSSFCRRVSTGDPLASCPCSLRTQRLDEIGMQVTSRIWNCWNQVPNLPEMIWFTRRKLTSSSRSSLSGAIMLCRLRNCPMTISRNRLYIIQVEWTQSSGCSPSFETSVIYFTIQATAVASPTFIRITTRRLVLTKTRSLKYSNLPSRGPRTQ